MISKLRKYTETWISKILLALISVSFLFWGLGGSLFESRNTAVSVASRKITVREVEAEFRRQIAQVQYAMGGVGFDYRQALQAGFLDQVVDNMVYRIVLDMEAADLGIRVSDERIYSIIQSMKEFQDGEGNFSPEQFAYLLDQNGIPERAFLSELANSVARDMFSVAVSSAIGADMLAEMLFRQRGETRVVDVAKFETALQKPPSQPSDSDLDSIYEANIAKFGEPEYRSLSYVAITSGAAMKYKNLKQGQADPNKVYRAMYEMGENIIDEINGGAGLAEAAKSFGVSATRLPEMDVEGKSRSGASVKVADFAPKHRDIAFFALDEGGVSDVLETSGDSVVLVFVDKVFPARPKPLAEVRPELLRMWTLDERKKEAARKADAALASIGAGAQFNRAALDADSEASVRLNSKVRKTGAPYPDGLVERLFQAELGRPFVFRSDDAAYVAAVRSIAIPEISAGDMDAFGKFRAAVQGGFAASMLDDYVLSYLYGKFGVRKNADALKLFYGE
ncbi:MAG: SurA N-terminal domain-containing protein [Rickettsiales bacterium]|jgi:hypothetical protein|nr:SurA N-terminal domain-containing protein [Rickettsiales bacterium]